MVRVTVVQLHPIFNLEGYELIYPSENIKGELLQSPDNEREIRALVALIGGETHGISQILCPAGSPAFNAVFSVWAINEGKTLWFSHSVREFREEPQPDGSIKKINIFKHVKFLKIIYNKIEVKPMSYGHMSEKEYNYAHDIHPIIFCQCGRGEGEKCDICRKEEEVKNSISAKEVDDYIEKSKKEAEEKFKKIFGKFNISQKEIDDLISDEDYQGYVDKGARMALAKKMGLVEAKSLSVLIEKYR